MTGMMPDIRPGFTGLGPWIVSLGYPFYDGHTPETGTQETAAFIPLVTL